MAVVAGGESGHESRRDEGRTQERTSEVEEIVAHASDANQNAAEE